METITVPSSIIAPSSEASLSPGMVAALWEIANALDVQRVPAKVEDAVWLKIPTQHLRGPDGRSDNVNLRQWLDRLNGLKLQGEYRGDPWGAVMVAEWHIEQGGSLARILIPPAAVLALRSADTFAKIETAAAHQLPGHARRLYALLADKKRLGKPEWTFDLDQLRALMGVADKKTYLRWASFRDWVLTPAIAGINDYGTVTVTMEPVKRGRAVDAVKFSWAWKTLDEAHVTNEENERHSAARRKEEPASPDAPPLVEAEPDPVVREGMTQLLGSLGSRLRVDHESLIQN
jgi:hypothetical protein